MKKRALTCILAGLTLVGMSHIANATPFGYELTISGGNSNVPTFTLTNTGSIDITGYSLTIGNTAYNWDAAYHEIDTDSVGYTLLSPDTYDYGGLRSDVLEYSFTSFHAGSVFSHQADLDKDSSNTLENYRDILWNNGSSISNALLTISFLGGDYLSMTLPDADYSSTYTFTQSGGASVPEPTTMLLFGTGLVGLVGSRIRKKRKN